MPNDFKKSYAPPKPNRMRQLFNLSAMSEKDTKENPDLASAWAGREIEMPAEAAATKAVRPMNWLEKNTVGRDAAGLTWPWGTIAINPEVVAREKMNLGEVLAHELTHVGQYSNPMNIIRGAYNKYTKNYGEEPAEQEAFNFTAQRKVRSKDIDLDKQPLRKKYAGK